MSYNQETRPGEVLSHQPYDQKGAADLPSSAEHQNQALVQRRQSSFNQPQVPHSQSNLLQSSNTSSPSISTASWTRFAIPTREDSLSSGFPFHPRLYDLKVTNDQWHVFTYSLTTAAKLTPQEDYLAWSTGIATGALSLPFIVFFAPWAGYRLGRRFHRKKQSQTVQEKLTEAGDLRAILQKWNTETFAQLGFQAWLEVPRVAGELVRDSNEIVIEAAKSEKEQKKMMKAAARRFKIIIIPNGNGAPSPALAKGSVRAQGPTEMEASSQYGDLNEAGEGQENRPLAAELHEDIALPPTYLDSKGNDFLPPSGPASQSSAPTNNYQRPEGFSNS